jgi:hypothetical protein
MVRPVMGWARFDDGYSDHPKILEAGPWAELLDMRAIIYCARYDTDGRLTTTGLRQIRRGIPKLVDKVDRLVAVGRWSTDPAGGWQVRAFLEHNIAKVDRDRMRASTRERQAKFRAARNGVTNTSLSRGGEGDLLTRCADCGKLELDCQCNHASSQA